jgi:K+-transporting ATPase A subunit
VTIPRWEWGDLLPKTQCSAASASLAAAQSAGHGRVSPDSAFNTAVSFVTNTNWQGYGGESTMSYLTQMLALAVQNFLSAATGIVVVIALIRGFARHRRRRPSATPGST